ncbi:HAD hydrolase, IIB family protein, partial [Vibrio parahaemolyticus EKP-028]
TYLRIWFKA